MKKLLVLAGGVAGYVLGTRAGRERYAQIKRGSSKFWRSAPVQATVDEAEGVAKQAAAAAGSKITDAAEAVREKVGGQSTQSAAAESVPPVSPQNPVVVPTEPTSERNSE